MKINGILARSVILGGCLLGVTTLEAVNYAAVKKAVGRIGSKAISEIEVKARNWKPKGPRNPRRTWENAKEWLREHECEHCFGGWILCPSCKGQGRIICYDAFGNPMVDAYGYYVTQLCGTCMGTCKIRCRHCQ